MRALILGVVIIAVCCTGCAVQRFPVVPSPKNTAVSEARERAGEYFLKARDYDRRGLGEIAEGFYELACEFDPASQTLKRILAERYAAAGKFARIVVLLKGDRLITTLADEDLRLVASAYARMGQFGNAAEALAAIKTKRDEELYMLGVLYESMGNNRLAIAVYGNFLKSSSATLETGLKVINLCLRQKQYDYAESLAVDLGRRFGEQADLLNGLGVIKLYKGDTTLALNFFKMAITLDTTCYEAVRNLGQYEMQRGNYKQAIGFYRTLYSQSELAPLYGRTLALLFYYDSSFDSAAIVLQSLLSVDPNDAELHYYFGLTLVRRDSLDQAIIEFEKTVAINNQFDDAWRQLCYAAIADSNRAHALNVAQRYTVAVGNPLSWRTLGYLYNTFKEHRLAIPALQRASAADPADAFTWFELGSAYERLQNIDSAAIAFRRVLGLRPRDDVTANYLGYMWAEQGVKLDSARVLIEQALSIDSGNGAYLDSYAWVLFKQGDYNGAFEFITKAMTQIGSDPTIFEHLGDILCVRGDRAGAREAYKKGIALKAPNAAVVQKKLADCTDQPHIH